MAGKKSRISEGAKLRLTADVDGQLRSEYEDLEERTGITCAEIVRQALIRLVREVKGSGKLTMERLP